MMDLLHIKSLRPGADGNNPSAPNAANYDETRANPYPRLPDPLRLNNGQWVTTAAQWWHERRPQIEALFDSDIYGHVPAKIPVVHWQLIGATQSMIGKYRVITERVVGHVDNKSYPFVNVDIQLNVTVPARAASPVPVIMELAWTGKIAQMIHRMEKGPDWRQEVLALGWGYAEYIPTSVQPDDGADLTHGIIGLVNKGQPRRPDQWGALRAWAWGASRAVDYLQSDRLVDGSQIGIEGHSRYGKAALIAMAYDPRIAIGYISSSGAGGAKLLRRNFGETLENLAGVGEYHWMAGNFLKYAGPLTEKDLPVDAHELIAMCAPRPVFISGGSPHAGDGWVDARGMFMAAAAAGPVYKLLGKNGLESDAFPPIGTPLLSGDIAFRQHHQGHTPVPNWPYFLTFARRYIHAR
ncbi:MAG: acetylxylan esterase [Alphaproteobacteria bacterium]|nr:acetylxylan esterase [Alphaproteobacteria bacterium]